MFNSRKSQPISSIKERVQKRVKGNYTVSHLQKTLTYYQLHLQQIVFIQRWFRKRLVTLNKKNQTLVLAKLQQREQLKHANAILLAQFGRKQEQRTALMNMSYEEFIKEGKNALEEKVRKVVRGTLENADRLAHNNGRAKYALSEIKVNQNQSQQLQGEIEGLKFQLQCHQKRKTEWKEKLTQLRQAVKEEALRSRELELRLYKVRSERGQEDMNQSAGR